MDLVISGFRTVYHSGLQTTGLLSGFEMLGALTVLYDGEMTIVYSHEFNIMVNTIYHNHYLLPSNVVYAFISVRTCDISVRNVVQECCSNNMRTQH